MIELLMGADPEVFVKKRGLFRSAHGLVRGTKAKPYKVEKGAVQVDGMALEFNIDPAASEDEFVENLTVVMGILEAMVPDYEVVVAATADFSARHMKEQPAEALELGCEPDYNAYTGNENPAPDGNVLFRSAAGHIHVGWTEGVDPHHPEHFEACKMLGRELDMHLALPLCQYDRDQRRRELYGQPGAFRPKPYGMEYRVLSNKWLDDPKLMRWVYQGVHTAFEGLVKGEAFTTRHVNYASGQLQVIPNVHWPQLRDTFENFNITNIPQEFIHV